MPMLTPQQFLFIFFADTYSLNNLISENIALLNRAVNKYRLVSPHIRLAYEVMNNTCDENFFLVFMGIQSTTKQFYKNYLDEVYNVESDLVRKKMFNERIKGDKSLTQKEVNFLVKEMATQRSEKISMALAVYPVVFYKDLEYELLTHFIGKLLFKVINMLSLYEIHL